MNESNAIRIADVKYKGDYTLRLRWANDKALTVDLREPVFRLKGMRTLRDTAAFALGRVNWPRQKVAHKQRPTHPYVAPHTAKIHTLITLGIRHRNKPLV